MPPVLVPATQSKSSLVGRPASFSRAINIWINTRPLIPPPSRHSSLSILQERRQTNSDHSAFSKQKNWHYYIPFLWHTHKLHLYYSLLFVHSGAIHFRCAFAHCTNCSPHIHDVLKPCQPITTAIDMIPALRVSIDWTMMENKKGSQLQATWRF